MQRFIQAVLFDLGDTLMYSPAPWLPVFEQAGNALAQSLCKEGLDVNCDTFGMEFRERLEAYYIQREQNLFETSTTHVLQELLDEKGFPNVSDQVIRKALDAHYAITQTNWQVEQDTLPTLRALESDGYRMGLVSNAGDNRDVFQLVERFGIEPYFDFVLTSAACSYRKPHPRIFELALAHWGFMPDEVAMAGDRLEADVLGSKRLGIFAIWIKRRAKHPEIRPAEPDATIESLSQIPPLLRSL